MTTKGLYNKYRIERTDNKPIGPWFILEYTTDHHARTALAAYADSCAADNPTLADDLRTAIARSEPNPGHEDHAIVVTAAGVSFVCIAAPGEQCRLMCVHECEDYHLPQCDRSTKDSGNCGALIYLDPADPADTYIGSTDREDWHTGPVSVEWDGFYESWLWRYPGEDRELPGFAQ